MGSNSRKKSTEIKQRGSNSRKKSTAIKQRGSNSRKKSTAIDQMVKDIKEMLDESGETIIIECLGTPGSRKTEFINYMRNLFIDYDAKEYFNGREDFERNRDNSDPNYYKEMLKKRFNTVYKDLFPESADNNPGKIIFYDRGLFDLFVCLKYEIYRGNVSEEYFNRVVSSKFTARRNNYGNCNPLELRKKMCESDDIFLKLQEIYAPISIVFITDPKISIKRNGKSAIDSMDYYDEEIDDSRLRNKKHTLDSIECYNEALEDVVKNIEDCSQRCIFVHTDYDNGIKMEYKKIAFRVLKNIREVLLNMGLHSLPVRSDVQSGTIQEDPMFY